MYTQEELVRGSTMRRRYNKKGKFIGFEHVPLDPGLYRASMQFYHPPKMPEAPKPPEQANATIASTGQGVQQDTKPRRTLASLLIKRNKQDPTQINQSLGGSFLPAGSLSLT